MALRLHGLRIFPRDVGIVLGIAWLAAGTAAAQAPLDRPDFEIPRFADLAADTVRTAIGTIPHAPEHVRWRRRDDLEVFRRPGLTIGVTVRDIDGDGDLDAYFARKVTWSEAHGIPPVAHTPDGDSLPPSELAWNEGDGRWRVERVPGPPVDVVRHDWIDLDLDGDLDLVTLQGLARIEDAGRVEILRNDAGRFVPWPAGPAERGRIEDASAFAVGDLDLDGHPDLAVLTGAGVVRLLGPDFRPAAPDPVVVPRRPKRAAMQILRLGASTTPDIIVYDAMAHMGRHDLVTIVDIAGGVRPAPEPLDAAAYFGLSRADVNGDGRLDVFLGASDFHGGRNTLLVSTPDGYRATGSETGLHGGYTYTNGASWADVDHDGRLDVFQPRHRGETMPVRSELFRRLEPDDGGPRFGALRGAADPAVVGASNAAAWFDLDDDGDLDLFVARHLDYSTTGDLDACGDLLFENVSITGAWLQVDVRPRRGTPLGTRVTVVAGGRTVVRFVGEGGTQGSSANPLRLHFGLGDVSAYDRLEVRWPNGTEETWGPGAVDRRIRLTEGEAPAGR